MMPAPFSAFDLSPITEDNYDPAYRLQTGCHAFPWSRGQFIDCLQPPYFAFQMQKEQEVIGFYVGLQVSVEATLMDIGVTKAQRGCGYGRELVKHFLRQCHQKQAHEALTTLAAAMRKIIDQSMGIFRETSHDLNELAVNMQQYAQKNTAVLIETQRNTEKETDVVDG